VFEQVHIGFIGGGNMGEALIRGLLKARLVPPERVHVCDVSKSRTAHLAAAYGVSILEDEARIASSCGIVVIAVKPQNVFQVLERIRDHLAHGLDNPANDIFFVGYQAKGTPGRAIQEGRIPVKARVHTLSGYSAHADQKTLVAWVQAMPAPPAHIRLVHGEPPAQAALARVLGINMPA